MKVSSSLMLYCRWNLLEAFGLVLERLSHERKCLPMTWSRLLERCSIDGNGLDSLDAPDDSDTVEGDEATAFLRCRVALQLRDCSFSSEGQMIDSRFRSSLSLPLGDSV